MKRLLSALLLLAAANAAAGEKSVSLERNFGTLYGTLLTPDEGAETVAVLIAGSGPTPRNGNTNNYLYLAQELEKAGIATLRYDKRGIGSSKFDDPDKMADATLDDFIGDAAAWAEYLSRQDFRRIVLIGHSEGALIAFCAAQQCPEVDAVISLAGAGYPLDEILQLQLAAQLAPTHMELLMQARAITAALKRGERVESCPPELTPLFAPPLQTFWISSLSYDPREEIRKVTVPVKDQNNEDIYNESDILIRKGAQYIGVPVGCELGNKNGGNDNQRVYYSFLAGGYATPQPIMFAAEGWFLRAEAKLRWTDAGQQSVKELYEKGIEVSIRNQKSYRQSDAAAAWTEKKLTAPDWAAIDDAAISSYINDDTSSPEGYTDPWKPEYNSDPTTSITVKWDEGASNEEKLERIITQKWIANFPLSTEAWADYRRTGYPKLFRPKQNLAPSIIDTQLGPRRLLYNETELSSNTVEVNNAIQLLKAESSEVKGDGDTGGTRLWWDRKDKGNF